MKNYYDQQQELQTALYRLETLKEKKQLYFNMTQPGTMDYSKDNVQGGVHKDLMTEYVIKIEKIDNEIEMLESEIDVLNKYLKKMEQCLRSMKGSMEKIFVARYIDDKSVNQIMHIVNYSKSSVYRELQRIEEIIK
jgi:phage shock protein A